MIKKAFTIALLSLTLTACASPRLTESESKPVATSATAPRDTDGIIGRFTNDIWPAINAKNGKVSGQGGRIDQQFDSIVDGDIYLRDVVLALGNPGYGTPNDALYRDPTIGLQLAHVDLTALNPPSATLTVCYTYTLVDHDRTTAQPTASQITAELHKTDTWYLHDLRNDHVVPNCPTNKG